jgi:hypothetical protein
MGISAGACGDEFLDRTNGKLLDYKTNSGNPIKRNIFPPVVASEFFFHSFLEIFTNSI